MITEAMVKAEIREYLNALPLCWRVAFQATGFGRRGIPDELVCYRGRFIALECKRPPETGKPRKRNPDAEKWQDREIASIRASGGRAEIVWTLEQVKAVIAAVDAELDRITSDDIIDDFNRHRGWVFKDQVDGSWRRVPLPFKKLSDG